MYLVDANVLSEPTKQAPAQSVIDWLADNESELAVNPIVLGELEYGILRMPAGRRRTRLLNWFAEGLAHLCIFPMDRLTGSAWAVLLADLAKNGRAMPITDSLIAATARQHRLTVATRNTRDYQHAGVPIVNPFDSRS